MKLIVPDYYPAFRCIAGACRHSCCIGWEIDVGADSMDRFRLVQGEMGRRLRENIDAENGCFRLGEGERCPFLNQQGLCDLILELGEDSLCQICADHPRFRNFLSDRTEMGLGLCCEAAAELILTREEPMRLITLEEDGEAQEMDTAFLAFRERLMVMAQDRGLPMERRVENILRACGADMTIDYAAWEELLMGLERLDDAWPAVLRRLEEPERPVEPRWEVPLEQLMCYLLFRHLAGALEDGDLQGRAVYCWLIWKLLRRMLRDDLPELARLYSSEIEYSDENMDAILEKINDLLFG